MIEGVIWKVTEYVTVDFEGVGNPGGGEYAPLESGSSSAKFCSPLGVSEQHVEGIEGIRNI